MYIKRKLQKYQNDLLLKKFFFFFFLFIPDVHISIESISKKKIMTHVNVKIPYNKNNILKKLGTNYKSNTKFNSSAIIV